MNVTNYVSISSLHKVKYVWIFAFCFVAILAGCHGKPSVVGWWKLDMAHIPNGTTQADRDIAQQVIALANIDLKDDMTFASDGLSGTYTLEGNHITLTITAVMGMKVEDYGKGRKLEPVSMDMSKDGEVLTAHLVSEPGPKGVLKDLRMIRNRES